MSVFAGIFLALGLVSHLPFVDCVLLGAALTWTIDALKEKN